MDKLATSDVIMGLVGLIAAYVGWILKKLSISVERLNERMADTLARLAVKEDMLKDHELRLRDLERARERLASIKARID